jgi:NTE family protein
MNTARDTDLNAATDADKTAKGKFDYTGQVVLVLQGGGALGAYQVGVYQALHEAGVEPDWVIGTSIGAINGAIIAGNEPAKRMEQLTRFWDMVRSGRYTDLAALWPVFTGALSNLGTYTQGIDGFFAPNPQAAWGVHTQLGVENASFYSTAPLRETLTELVDFKYINAKHTRLTLGAVNVRSGDMHYFDSRESKIKVEHAMASGALPPAFPAVRIGGSSYWDGGVYSNTPIEAVLDDKPRRNSLIFSANLWHPQGAEPETIWQVLARHKDIQYASRAKSHIMRQQQIPAPHHSRSVPAHPRSAAQRSGSTQSGGLRLRDGDARGAAARAPRRGRRSHQGH